MAKIYWDKGHGAHDPGIVANGMQEKVLVHKIVEYAMAYMNANYTGFVQKTSRVGDTYPTLTGRCADANAWGADVFISVHINGGGGTGYESYVLNRNDRPTNSLQDNLNREILAANAPYGKKAHGGNPIKSADYAVLRGTNMPAVLTENLYLDSADANTLRDEGYLKAIGQAHARGVAAHLGLSKVSNPQPPTSGGATGESQSAGIGIAVSKYPVGYGVNLYNAPDGHFTGEAIKDKTPYLILSGAWYGGDKNMLCLGHEQWIPQEHVSIQWFRAYSKYPAGWGVNTYNKPGGDFTGNVDGSKPYDIWERRDGYVRIDETGNWVKEEHFVIK